MKRLLPLLALSAMATHAAELPLWELGLGAGVLNLPHYRGSDQSHTWLLPVPYVVYRGHIFKADREGARAVLYESNRLNFDLSVSASAPTRSDDNVARRGMADLPPTFEVGPNLNYTLARDTHWKLDLRAPVRAAVTLQSHPRTIGWTATPNINLDLRDLGGWHLGLQAALLYADRRYNAHFYEVAPADALPDRPAYAARGGFGGGQLIAATSRRFGNTWAGAFVKYDTLNGAVFADSPLVRQRHHWSFGVAFSWVFAASKQTVPSAD
ncbi:MipA/OmpV family protein [Ideonella sp. BN130291]|uniref:MipA/OmpV family protein n=1 Tax=Ideonella sp. BN130291 TaxID=3112940 RepID=UPI002E2705DB|nr:MipA/OmpV family protein [Ideonella sp. BN130291]